MNMLILSLVCSRSPDRDAGRAGELQCDGKGAQTAVQRHESRQRKMGKSFLNITLSFLTMLWNFYFFLVYYSILRENKI